MARIFISYSRADRQFIDQFIPIIRRVYARQHDIWYDDEIHGGTDWWKMILDELARCDLFIYLISNESLESPYCQAEFREAHRLNKALLPVVIRRHDLSKAPDDIETLIGRIQRVDLTRGLKDTGATANLWGSINQQLQNYVPTSPRTVLQQHPVDIHETATQSRRLDAAMPRETVRNANTEVWVKISLPDSLGLMDELPDYTKSGDLIQKSDARRATFPIEFPLDASTGKLSSATVCISVESPDFEVTSEQASEAKCPENSYELEIPIYIDSRTMVLYLSPKSENLRIGRSRLSVKVLFEDKVIGQVSVSTEIVAERDWAISQWALYSSMLLGTDSGAVTSPGFWADARWRWGGTIVGILALVVAIYVLLVNEDNHRPAVVEPISTSTATSTLPLDFREPTNTPSPTTTHTPTVSSTSTSTNTVVPTPTAADTATITPEPPSEIANSLPSIIRECYGTFDVPNRQVDISARQIDALLPADFTDYASLRCSFIRTVTILGEFDDGEENGSERNLYDRLEACESFSRADATVGLLYALIKNADVAALAASDELCGESIVDLETVELPLINDDSSSACEQTVHETIRLNRLTPSQKFTMLSVVNILPIYSIDENFGFCEFNQDWIAQLERIQLFNGIEEPTIESIVESFKIGLLSDDDRFITQSNLQNELLVGTGVFQAQLDGRSAIFLIAADGTTQQLDTEFTGNQFYPTMRTDNRAVAFLREDQGDAKTAYTLTINVLNNEIVPFQNVDINGLLSEAGLDAEGYMLAKSRLTWHPSGQHLLFTMVNSESEHQIFAVSVDDRGFAEDITPLSSGSSPSFAPNGTYYVQVSNDDAFTVVPWNVSGSTETFEIGAPYLVLEVPSQEDLACVAPIVSASSYAVFTACTRPVPDTDDVERSLLRIDADNSENVGVTELLRDTDIEISSLSLLGGTPYFTFIDMSGELYLYYPSEISIDLQADGDQNWVIQRVEDPSFAGGLPLEYLEWVQGDE